MCQSFGIAYRVGLVDFFVRTAHATVAYGDPIACVVGLSSDDKVDAVGGGAEIRYFTPRGLFLTCVEVVFDEPLQLWRFGLSLAQHRG